MRPINHLELAEICRELKGLEGLPLQDVHQPESAAVVLSFPYHMLLLQAADDRCRMHMIERKPRSPREPFGFGMLLRNRLLPSKLVAVDQPGGDRLVRFCFETKRGDEIETWYLVAELTARNANLFFLDQGDQIIGSIRGNRSDRRRLTPGNMYVPLDFRPAPVGLHVRFAPEKPTEPFAWNQAADRWFSHEEREFLKQRERSVLQRRWKALYKRLERTAAALQRDRQKAEQAPQLRRWADLLQIEFRNLKKGMKEIRVRDVMETGDLITVPLDPALEPRENIERLYARARKGKRALVKLDKREIERADEADRLERIKELIDEAEAPEDFKRIKDLLGIKEPPTHKATSEKKALPFRRFLSASSQEIWVGRNAKENDLLTCRHSRGDDFWYHAEGLAGSHVLVPLRNNRELDPDTHLDAATLAAHYSKGRGDTVEVSYTRARHVRKIKGAKPGQVLVSKRKTILIDPDSDRLARLKKDSDKIG